MKCGVCGQDNPPEARYCSQCGQILMPAVKPLPVSSVGSAYSRGWRQLWKHFWILLLVGIIYFVISLGSSVFNVIQTAAGEELIASVIALATVSIFSWAYNILLVNPLGYGVAFTYLKAARDEPVEVTDMFAVFKNYWNAVLASLLVGVMVVIGFILLIVPGIILGCKLAFTPYLVVDRKMGVIEAVKESWRMTNGHAWQVFLIGLLAIPISIAGLLCLGIGIIIAIMWVSMALASLYYSISGSTNLNVQRVESV